MKTVSIKKNFIMNILLTMSSFVFPLITFPYVTRVLQPLGTGRVAFAVSLISYFNVFAQLGIPTYGVRACAKIRDSREELSKTAHELIAINMIMSIIAYICLALALIFVPKLQDDRSLYVLVSVTIFLNTIGMEWLYKALEKYTYIAIRSILFKFIALIAMFALIHTEDDYVIYGGISVFAASASNIVNFLHSGTYIDWKVLKNYDLKRHLKPVGVFFAMACATTIYTNLDEVMLGFMAGNIEVGYYDAATKIKKVLLGVVTSLGVVVLPRASYYIEKGKKEEFWNIGAKAIHFIILLALPLMTFFMLFAKDTICVLAGAAYEGAILPMQLLMPTLLFIGMTNIMGIQILVPLNREREVLYSVIIGAIVDAVINAVLIPKLGASGAAIGTLVAELMVLIYQYYVLKEHIRFVLKSIRYRKIALALVAACTVSALVLRINAGSFLEVFIGACLFFVTYVAILLATKEDLSMEIISDMLSKVKRKKES